MNKMRGCLGEKVALAFENAASQDYFDILFFHS
jgi:hypothetical protein